MGESVPSQQIPAQEGAEGSTIEAERFRGEIGGRIVGAFVGGLVFLGGLVLLEVLIVGFGGKEFVGVDDIVKIGTAFGSVIGPPLGFVISYYFKGES